MAESFTSKQKEIVARKMGYDGPMQGFDTFLASSPSDALKYSAITSKFVERMAKGGYVKKYAAGGAIADKGRNGDTMVAHLTPGEVVIPKEVVAMRPDLVAHLFNQMSVIGADPKSIIAGYGRINPKTGIEEFATSDEVNAAYRKYLGRDAEPAGMAYQLSNIDNGNFTPDQIVENIKNSPEAASFKAAKASSVPDAPTAPVVTAATTAITPAMMAAAPVAAATQVAAPTLVGEASTVEAPAAVTADTITPTLPSAGIQTELDKLKATQGTVSDKAQAAVVTQDPATTAVSGVDAAQAQAGTVGAVADRTVQAGELVSGPTVDMAKVEETLAKTQAAQGVVADEMTVQGQLNKLLTNFDAGNPPFWAAASMRTATAQMAARGIGASSMAGQAIIQATLEASAPIAAADAKIQETMALQNLSNRQAVALDLGKQRAAFLGQEFDQSFQTRVLNAATISDIADKNFDASVTIAIENSRIASTTNLANLSARNALVLAEAAQIASLETSNLNNKQLVAVENAKAFLTMDLKNLDITQQTAVFKAKTITDALLSDASFANAAAATNASNKLESDKINATLTLTAQQYNAAERNKVKMANADAANELAKFNAQEANNREEFNSKMSAEINVVNAKILAEVSTVNTAATNAANALNAKNATDLSAAAYAQQSQTYRDLLEMSYNAGENEQNRLTQIAVATIAKSGTVDAASIKASADTSASLGALALKGLESWDKIAGIFK